MKLQYEGKLTAGHYNNMEAGRPVFIDGDSLSDIVKALLNRRGLSGDFCYWSPFKPEDVDNPLIGKKVRLTLEIEADEMPLLADTECPPHCTVCGTTEHHTDGGGNIVQNPFGDDGK